MKTSYYAKQEKYNFKDCISISIGMKWYKGKLPQAKELAPTWKMVMKSKQSGKIYPYQEYISLLQRRGLNPQSIYKKYKGKILLCWEKDPSTCHRRYLARWIEETLGIKLTEV
jgi:hypothetical protein